MALWAPCSAENGDECGPAKNQCESGQGKSRPNGEVNEDGKDREASIRRREVDSLPVNGTALGTAVRKTVPL